MEGKDHPCLINIFYHHCTCRQNVVVPKESMELHDAEKNTGRHNVPCHRHSSQLDGHNY